MEILGGLGVLVLLIAAFVLLVLALFVPYFIYSINRNVQQIQRDVSRLIVGRDEAKPTRLATMAAASSATQSRQTTNTTAHPTGLEG